MSRKMSKKIMDKLLTIPEEGLSKSVGQAMKSIESSEKVEEESDLVGLESELDKIVNE
jgi:hypothetical protein